jgi:hypothetical protein
VTTTADYVPRTKPPLALTAIFVVTTANLRLPTATYIFGDEPDAPKRKSDLPSRTANTITGNTCLGVLQFFSFPQIEDVEGRKTKTL